VISIVESSIEDFSIAGLVDTADRHDVNEQKSGCNVITNLATLLTEYEKYQYFECIVAIGDNLERANVFEKLKAANFRLPNIISSHAFVDRTVVMGSGNVIAHGSVINAHVVLGDNNIVNTSTVIEHDCALSSNIHIAPKAVLCGGVKIKSLVMIGASATIIPNLNVAIGVIIGAGAVLINSIAENDLIYVGVPAKEKIK
jgi:sugar O-acyltransferase (sialic acid O-acetyltransferase NeuD family)